MKLEISHSEIVSGITAFLASKGISGFDPAVVQVTFKSARGTGELSAVLDTDPAPAAPAETKPADKPKAEAKLTGQAETGGAASGGEASKPAEEPKVATEAAAEPTTEAGAATEAAPAAGGDDADNLFD